MYKHLIANTFFFRFLVYDALTGKMKDLNGHTSCVRDVAWHPYRNEILSSSVIISCTIS